MTSFVHKPTLLGERVALRPLVADDAPHLWLDLHDPDAVRLTGTHATFDRDQIDRWCATREEQTDRLDLAVVDRVSGDWLGEVVINDLDEVDEPLVHRISLEVFTFNPRAIAVYERVGFRREGVLRDALRWDGVFHDTIVMSILRTDRSAAA